jgi:hypothetical protein
MSSGCAKALVRTAPRRVNVEGDPQAVSAVLRAVNAVAGRH